MIEQAGYTMTRDFKGDFILNESVPIYIRSDKGRRRIAELQTVEGQWIRREYPANVKPDAVLYKSDANQKGGTVYVVTDTTPLSTAGAAI